MTCVDNPCQNGATCTDATNVCTDRQDVTCGFTCDCDDYYTGALCDVYQRCYNDSRTCYLTGYQTADYHTATSVCRRHHDHLTKPIILNQLEADNLREFIEQDPHGQLVRDSVWLAAESRGLPDSPTVYWQWLDGLVTSMYCSIVLCTLPPAVLSVCLSACPACLPASRPADQQDRVIAKIKCCVFLPHSVYSVNLLDNVTLYVVFVAYF